jgi:hypothetical protein
MTCENKLKDLHNDKSFFSRIKIFTYDLLSFESNELSRIRLEKKPATYYVSSVYFNDDEIKKVLSFPCATGLTLEQTLEKSFSVAKNEICTSHDLAPIFCLVFGIRKGFKNEKEFTKALKEFEKRTLSDLIK